MPWLWCSSSSATTTTTTTTTTTAANNNHHYHHHLPPPPWKQDNNTWALVSLEYHHSVKMKRRLRSRQVAPLPPPIGQHTHLSFMRMGLVLPSGPHLSWYIGLLPSSFSIPPLLQASFRGLRTRRVYEWTFIYLSQPLYVYCYYYYYYYYYYYLSCHPLSTARRDISWDPIRWLVCQLVFLKCLSKSVSPKSGYREGRRNSYTRWSQSCHAMDCDGSNQKWRIDSQSKESHQKEIVQSKEMMGGERGGLEAPFDSKVENTRW